MTPLIFHGPAPGAGGVEADQESFFALYKKELIHTHPGTELKAPRKATSSWIEEH
jgi:hypothetical protein